MCVSLYNASHSSHFETFAVTLRRMQTASVCL
jgi:hypothetical protein